ncbi:response regulator [Flavobacterium sp.]|uniref:response regulator n=1 Tax=Flavobacterium sp. TaxID=239 RepID=UPI002613E062|nr:response regulator [Flavobacterium sp.]
MSNAKKIYVVDDDKIYHFILKTFFKKNNLNVEPEFFENGLEAIQYLKTQLKAGSEIPKTILLDLNMPIMDGWQFLEEFRNLKSQHDFAIDVYVVTSSNDHSDLEKAGKFENEIVKYLLKPINDSLLGILS